MAPTYKLYYFNFTALGEPIRMTLAYGNIDFQDNRFSVEDWPKYKDQAPYGKCPWLEIDDKQMYQSGAICRYLAKKIGGLTGDNDWDEAQCDIVVDTISDIRGNYTKYFHEEEDRKAPLVEKIKKELNPLYLQNLEDLAKQNGGFLAASKLTWADIYFAGTAEFFSNFLKEDVLAKYPTLAALVEKVNNIPNISKYRKTRAPHVM